MFRLSIAKKEALAKEVDFQYSRSSGPGGQKVNKTESQVELHWSLLDTQHLNQEQRVRLAQKLKSRLNKSQTLVLHCDQFRSRTQNQNEVLSRFFELLEEALTKPKPRKKTKPTRASVEKRIQEKKRQADKKKNRQKF